ncbi:unnamed protein product [Vitrella brassicaformis CCMP3155]|uniref:Transmembrane protein n=2 Tax=Vitrella brassicaformis TaxID=1169539 RepID=A0A0G4FZK4_VITBC|nr:unnamed protein product [Vitrella brassicaformis CCMP3155]|eukprot:CEM20784.1 unnamed protein product [Vitrella brassicaformis CCMP3155]
MLQYVWLWAAVSFISRRAAALQQQQTQQQQQMVTQSVASFVSRPLALRPCRRPPLRVSPSPWSRSITPMMVDEFVPRADPKVAVAAASCFGVVLAFWANGVYVQRKREERRQNLVKRNSLRVKRMTGSLSLEEELQLEILERRLRKERELEEKRRKEKTWWNPWGLELRNRDDDLLR